MLHSLCQMLPTPIGQCKIASSWKASNALRHETSPKHTGTRTCQALGHAAVVGLRCVSRALSTWHPQDCLSGCLIEPGVLGKRTNVVFKLVHFVRSLTSTS
eukprot:5110101-Amphidinium_carterae.1